MCEPRNRDNGASDVWALTANSSSSQGKLSAHILFLSSSASHVKGVVSLTSPLSDLEVYKLAEEISPSDWRKLCFRLNIDDAVVARAERENAGHLAEAIYKTLAQWRQGQSESEERSKLLEALISCGLRRLEDRLCKGMYDAHVTDTQHTIFAAGFEV